MRFLSMIRVNEKSGQVPSEQLMHDMGKLIDEMTRDGVLVRTAGLRPTAEGTRVRLRQGQISTVDGPFIETRERRRICDPRGGVDAKGDRTHEALSADPRRRMGH